MFVIARPFTTLQQAFSPSCKRQPFKLDAVKTRLFDESEAYRFYATVPGIAANGFTVRVSDTGALTVTGNNKKTGEVVYHKVIQLPNDANQTSIRSWCENGVLEIAIDKLKPTEPYAIPVEAKHAPEVDSKSFYEFKRNVPGVGATHVSVTVENDLKLGGEWLAIGATSDFATYKFRMGLPEDAQSSATTAFCLNGVLTVQVPKQCPPAPVSLPVESSFDVNVDELEVFKLFVPGYGPSDVKLVVEPEWLSVTLEKEGLRTITRHAPLPKELNDPKNLQAGCMDGVLRVKVAKDCFRKPEEMEVEVCTQRPEEDSGNRMEVEESNDKQGAGEYDRLV